jgi:TetR/AcrR family transcriptional regulator, fatty acid metabolism regulator protein
MVPKLKLTKRKAQAQKTKKTIYKVAMQLMNKQGFNNTTIEEISKKAHVSVGTFYLYYKSKDDIFFELYHKADVYFKNEVSRQLAEKNSLDQIMVFFKCYAKYNYERGLDAISQLYNTKNKLFIAKGRYMGLLLEKIIETGQEKKELILDMTPQSIAGYLFIVARGTVYDWCLHDGDYDLEETMTRHIARLLPIFRATLSD